MAERYAELQFRLPAKFPAIRWQPVSRPEPSAILRQSFVPQSRCPEFPSELAHSLLFRPTHRLDRIKRRLNVVGRARLARVLDRNREFADVQRKPRRQTT